MKKSEKKTHSNSTKKKTRKASSLRPHRKPSLSRRKTSSKIQSSNTYPHKEVKTNLSQETAQIKLLKELELKYKNLEKQYHFLQAEYANYKKQTLKKMEDIKKYDGENIIQSFIHNVKDNFERALEVDITTESINDFKKGIQMIYVNLQKVLSDAGVKELDCQGEQFDPIKHSAIGLESSDTIPSEHITRVLKKAYVFHDKVIRPAEVIISDGKEEQTIKEETGE